MVTRYVDKITPDVDATFALGYKVTRSGATLALDVLQPKDDKATNRRAVVMFHGGGFHEGDKADTFYHSADLAQRGYVVFNCNYTLTQFDWTVVDARLQPALAATQDAWDAIAWVKARAGFLRVDPEHVYGSGYSAGAIIAWNLAEEARVRAAGVIAGYPTLVTPTPGNPVLDCHGTADTIIPITLAQPWVGAHDELVHFSGANHDVGWVDFAAVMQHIADWMDAHA